ncbi:hypothetical protein PC119_g4713 [Phytophthora cactorum]|uniref:Uncharacterized protein n=1 Tax=Phytophthora cactorum TaxID=29920 RepID=A0A8T1E671_9STRA|nr:hypothetical protein PC114_g4895 [Phytophthora cactorum]KAG2949859.1 hypothetical protein PC117_g4882 [Phytophthora cactorum]KAG3034948.1 hypothetical protein PC119_g4713 [Phytophthora cactorum]KAG3185473.1 hypothetical protein C6341_g4434 [Phytophthora cactorum]
MALQQGLVASLSTPHRVHWVVNASENKLCFMMMPPLRLSHAVCMKQHSTLQ